MFWIIQWAKSATWKNEFDVPIRNFARVTDGVYRGARPGAGGASWAAPRS